MDELSLDDLLGALEDVQQQKSTVRLSERNVVELVSKLQERGLLGRDLLHTINGREYLTPERLRDEVVDAVAAAGGRIALVDLPPLLGVDLVHCEREAGAAVAAARGAMRLVQGGELVTDAYFEGVAAEIDETLQEAGQVVLGDLARRFNLSSDLLLPVVTSQLGSRIRGRLQGGLLFTPAFIARVKAQLRGALRGAAAPLSLPALAKTLGLESSVTGGGMLGAIVEELVAEGAVQGSLKGGGNSWTPAVYSRTQQEAVLSFYRQNRVIEYAAVAKLGIPSAQAHLQAAFPDGIALETAFVAPELVQQLDGAVEEALSAELWVDVQPLLPSILTAADTAVLLAASPVVQAAQSEHGSSRASGGAGEAAAASIPQGATIVAETCVVSAAFEHRLQGRAIEDARAAAAEQLRLRKASSASATTSGAAAPLLGT